MNSARRAGADARAAWSWSPIRERLPVFAASSRAGSTAPTAVTHQRRATASIAAVASGSPTRCCTGGATTAAAGGLACSAIGPRQRASRVVTTSRYQRATLVTELAAVMNLAVAAEKGSCDSRAGRQVCGTSSRSVAGVPSPVDFDDLVEQRAEQVVERGLPKERDFEMVDLPVAYRGRVAHSA